jgi:hypothetical protein
MAGSFSCSSLRSGDKDPQGDKPFANPWLSWCDMLPLTVHSGLEYSFGILGVDTARSLLTVSVAGTQTHRHTDTQTHRRSNTHRNTTHRHTQTHRHTDTQTHKHTHTHTQTHAHSCTHTYSHTNHTQTNNFSSESYEESADTHTMTIYTKAKFNWKIAPTWPENRFPAEVGIALRNILNMLRNAVLN